LILQLGQKILSIACGNGDMNTVEALLQAGANENLFVLVMHVLIMCVWNL